MPTCNLLASYATSQDASLHARRDPIKILNDMMQLFAEHEA